jgi:pimeloyl-ACP methyl ester carboxylesterase
VTVVLLHDLGAEEAGAPWRAVAPADWVVPDLPGHGATPAPRHGAYDPLGPTTLARWALEGEGRAVGIGQNAHAALILAAGGGCDSVAIVDGLWGEWMGASEAVDGMYDGLRSLLADHDATDPPPPSGLDPRARHGYGVTMSRRFARLFWRAVTCPVLVVDTPASPTPTAERGERASWFGGPTSLVALDTADPGVVVAAVAAWAPVITTDAAPRVAAGPREARR